MHFLLAKGYKQDIATRHVVDYDQIQLDPDCESALLTYFTFMHLIVIMLTSQIAAVLCNF